MLGAIQAVAASCYGPLPGADKSQPGQCRWENQSGFLMCNAPICKGWGGCVPFDVCRSYYDECVRIRNSGQAAAQCDETFVWWTLTCDGVSSVVQVKVYTTQVNAPGTSYFGVIKCDAAVPGSMRVGGSTTPKQPPARTWG